LERPKLGVGSYPTGEGEKVRTATISFFEQLSEGVRLLLEQERKALQQKEIIKRGRRNSWSDTSDFEKDLIRNYSGESLLFDRLSRGADRLLIRQPKPSRSVSCLSRGATQPLRRSSKHDLIGREEKNKIQEIMKTEGETKAAAETKQQQKDKVPEEAPPPPEKEDKERITKNDGDEAAKQKETEKTQLGTKEIAKALDTDPNGVWQNVSYMRWAKKEPSDRELTVPKKVMADLMQQMKRVEKEKETLQQKWQKKEEEWVLEKARMSLDIRMLKNELQQLKKEKEEREKRERETREREAHERKPETVTITRK